MDPAQISRIILPRPSLDPPMKLIVTDSQGSTRHSPGVSEISSIAITVYSFSFTDKYLNASIIIYNDIHLRQINGFICYIVVPNVVLWGVLF